MLVVENIEMFMFTMHIIYFVLNKKVGPKLHEQLQILENKLEFKEYDNIIYGTIETWILWKLSKEKTFATEISCGCCTGFYDTFLVCTFAAMAYIP